MADLDTHAPTLNMPAPRRENPLTRSVAGMVGIAVLGAIMLLAFGSAPWTFGRASAADGIGLSSPRYEAGSPQQARVQPLWWPMSESTTRRLIETMPAEHLEPATEAVAAEFGLSPAKVLTLNDAAVQQRLRRELDKHWPRFLVGSDALGRSLGVRLLAGGTISLGIGLAAALISVFIGTLYGAVAGYAGGRIDALMMRIVDVLYGLPYILLVVLIAVAADGLIDRVQRAAIADRASDRSSLVEQRRAAEPGASEERIAEFEAEALDRYGTGELSSARRTQIDVLALLVAIGGVSWLTMARVVRGQVLSLKSQPFVEAARAIGAPVHWIFARHLLPNLLGPIIVYTTLTVPQAILQESFLSFLGIGVKPPLPSWGNLAADGLSELNRHQSHWWLLLFPCLLLGATLLALNFVGEGLREAFDPRRARR
jgi:ABC-type dipeptide/oligopeptide/nickel transport system permease subunit